MAANHGNSYLAGLLTIAFALTACTPESPAPAEPANTPDAPVDGAAPPAELPAPTGTPAPETEPVPPSDTPPPPGEPSAAPKPTSAEPALDAMHAATPSAKMSVAVDLRYQFETEPVAGMPVTLHLAAVPRAGGTPQFSIKQVPGLKIAAGPLELRKSAAVDAYRQQLSLTRTAEGPETLRVLVTLETPEGIAGFGYYSIPLTGGNTARKQNSVKQR